MGLRYARHLALTTLMTACLQPAMGEAPDPALERRIENMKRVRDAMHAVNEADQAILVALQTTREGAAADLLRLRTTRDAVSMAHLKTVNELSSLANEMTDTADRRKVDALLRTRVGEASAWCDVDAQSVQHLASLSRRIPASAQQLYADSVQASRRVCDVARAAP